MHSNPNRPPQLSVRQFITGLVVAQCDCSDTAHEVQEIPTAHCDMSMHRLADLFAVHAQGRAPTGTGSSVPVLAPAHTPADPDSQACEHAADPPHACCTAGMGQAQHGTAAVNGAALVLGAQMGL